MLIAWTWSQLAHEGGIFAMAAIVVVCLAYLTRRVVSVLRTRERKLLDQGIATGLTLGARENLRRFSLLDLLVAITLVGGLAGLMKGLAGEDEHGMPYKLDDEWGVLRDIDNMKQREIN